MHVILFATHLNITLIGALSGGSEQICHSKVVYTIHFMLYSVLCKGKKLTIIHTSCKMIYLFNPMLIFI